MRKSLAPLKRQSVAARLLQPQEAADEPGVTLNHGDIIAFGQSLFFFVDPSKSPAEVLILSNQVSYAAARKEMARKRWDIPRKLIRIIGAMGRKDRTSASLGSSGMDNSDLDSEVEEMLAAKDRELEETNELLTASNKENEELKRLLDDAKRELAAKESELITALEEVRVARVDPHVGKDSGEQSKSMLSVISDAGGKGSMPPSPRGDLAKDLSAEVSSTFEEVLQAMDRLDQHFAKH